MADLRQVFEDLGYRDVRTLLNSGNVVFTVDKSSGAANGTRIQKVIADRLGVTTRVIVLNRREVAAAVEENRSRWSLTTWDSLPTPSLILRFGRVIAETLPDLFPSIGVLRKIGFSYAGEGSEPGVIRYELRRADIHVS